MAALFQLDSSVLHFGPRMPAGVEYSRRKFLLWPALMYRVVAPEVRPRQINILQKTVLGMCRAGITFPPRTSEAEDSTEIWPPLSWESFYKGGSSRPMDCRRSRATRFFENETLDMRPPVTGHVFQDPWSENYDHDSSSALTTWNWIGEKTGSQTDLGDPWATSG